MAHTEAAHPGKQVTLGPVIPEISDKHNRPAVGPINSMLQLVRLSGKYQLGGCGRDRENGVMGWFQNSCERFQRENKNIDCVTWVEQVDGQPCCLPAMAVPA